MSTAAYVRALFADSNNIEVRHQSEEGRWNTIWCRSVDDLRKTYKQLKDSGNLYTSIHHCPSPTNSPIRNADVDRYSRIFLDLDPVRPRGLPSTGTELLHACNRAWDVRRYMALWGWPVPAMGISGNGVHLYYRCAWPTTDEVLEMMRVVYDGLSRRFSDNLVKLDRAVSNPGRISCLFGTVKRKGVSTGERPHRVSCIDTPRYWRQIWAGALDKMANAFASKEETKPINRRFTVKPSHGDRGDYNTLDTLGFLSSHGISSQRVSENVYGIACPWKDGHSTSSPRNHSDSVIILRDSKWDIFHCHHDSCADRRLIDVINKFGDADSYCSMPYTPVKYLQNE